MALPDYPVRGKTSRRGQAGALATWQAAGKENWQAAASRHPLAGRHILACKQVPTGRQAGTYLDGRESHIGRQAHTWQAGIYLAGRQIHGRQAHTWQAGTYLAVRQASSQAYCQTARKAVTHWQAGRQALRLVAGKAGNHTVDWHAGRQVGRHTDSQGGSFSSVLWAS